MKFINLTADRVEIKTVSGKMITIEPSNQKIGLQIKAFFRKTTCYPTGYALELDADKIAIERKEATIAIPNLPDFEKGIAYIVDYKTQSLIRTFTKRSDFLTVIDNQLCDLRTSRKPKAKKNGKA